MKTAITMEGEKSNLASKLDKELQDYISNLKPKKYEDGWPEDKWEEEMVKHPFFMDKPISENEDVPPLVEALQQLKYDPDINSAEELAKSHKEDGNHYFKVKKYRWAVEAYSEGLKQNCSDKVLVSQLLVNRAAAHFHIGNYKKSLKDAEEAKTLNPDYVKAIHRGALCHFHLKDYDDCILWCEEGLKVEPSNCDLIDLKISAEKGKKLLERDKRKLAAKMAKANKGIIQLQEALIKRGINVKKPENLKPEHPDLSDSMVHLDESGSLIWPVIFLYPEHGMTDCIQCFHEDSRFVDHLGDMFAEANRPAWDQDGKYQLSKLKVLYKCKDSNRLVCVDINQSLSSVICDDRFELCSGTPTFFVTVKGSKFDEYWCKKITAS